MEGRDTSHVYRGFRRFPNVIKIDVWERVDTEIDESVYENTKQRNFINDNTENDDSDKFNRIY